MGKKEENELSDSLLIADALLRIKTLENLLVKKGLITQEEFSAEMEVIARSIAKSILEKANVQGDIEELVNSLRSAPPKKPPTEN
jgi:hypothetical protein